MVADMLRNEGIFDDRDIKWIKDLTRLKNCGMSIQEMKTYLELCLRGETSIPERMAMLARKRDELLLRIAGLNESVSYIDLKQQFYNDVLSGKTVYVSNLIQTKIPSNMEEETPISGK